MKRGKCIAAWLLTCALVITSLLSGAPASVSAADGAEAGLVNIAENCDVTVPENENGVANMFDGNLQTIWSPVYQAGWPATVTFKLPAENTKPVEKITIGFKVENAAQEN